ncbi:MAG TPA: ribosome recycling factor [Gammaproteobacteria bacterium]|nr:ribosome recycling factor [Gammaproteobacteria bacterium]
MIDDLKKDAAQRMQKAVEAVMDNFKKLRTGRAHTSLLDHITVDYYGSEVPLSQVANVTASDARTLSISPWEKTMVGVIEKAIMNSDMGLNPATSGTVIRVPLPQLTEERRRDMIKVVKQEAENGRIAIRNVRRDVLSDIKSLLKDKDISEDDDHRAQEDVQKLTDKYIAQIDAQMESKEREMMEV